MPRQLFSLHRAADTFIENRRSRYQHFSFETYLYLRVVQPFRPELLVAVICALLVRPKDAYNSARPRRMRTRSALSPHCEARFSRRSIAADGPRFRVAPDLSLQIAHIRRIASLVESSNGG